MICACAPDARLDQAPSRFSATLLQMLRSRQLAHGFFRSRRLGARRGLRYRRRLGALNRLRRRRACATGALGGCLIVGGAPGGERAGSAGATAGFCSACGSNSCGIRARGCGARYRGGARQQRRRLYLRRRDAAIEFRRLRKRSRIVAGHGGCVMTPRFGIGSATIGGATRVGDGTLRACPGTIDGAGTERPTDAGAGAEACGDGCTWFGLRIMSLARQSCNLRNIFRRRRHRLQLRQIRLTATQPSSPDRGSAVRHHRRALVISMRGTPRGGLLMIV